MTHSECFDAYCCQADRLESVLFSALLHARGLTALPQRMW